MAYQFIHRGALHTLVDSERMKIDLLAENHYWIDGWQSLPLDIFSNSPA